MKKLLLFLLVIFRCSGVENVANWESTTTTLASNGKFALTYVYAGDGAGFRKGHWFVFDTGSSVTVTTNNSAWVATSSVLGSGRWLALNENQVPAYWPTNASFTVTDNQYLILTDSTSGDVTLTLPTAIGRIGCFYKITQVAGTNATIIDGNGSQTIGGVVTRTLRLNESYEITSDNNNWNVTSRSVDGTSYLTDIGDTDYTITSATPFLVPYDTTLTGNRTVSVTTNGMYLGQTFRVVRTDTGAFTLNVGGR